METVTCPRCRTRIQASDSAARCPRCGVRTDVGIVAKTLARPTSTAVEAGLPAPVQRPAEKPRTVLASLLAHLRRWRRTNDYPGGGGDEADCRRIGWLLMLLSFLPLVVCTPLVLLFPAIAYTTFMRLDPETAGLGELLVVTVLIAVPLLLCAGLVWMVMRRRNRDDEGASC
jgi:hypothetical protein